MDSVKLRQRARRETPPPRRCGKTHTKVTQKAYKTSTENKAARAAAKAF